MGVLPKFQETLIHRALELDDVPVREIMTPRQMIHSLPSNMLIEEASASIKADCWLFAAAPWPPSVFS